MELLSNQQVHICKRVCAAHVLSALSVDSLLSGVHSRQGYCRAAAAGRKYFAGTADSDI